MTSYKGDSRKIKDGLVQILQGITYDGGSGQEPAFAQVITDSRDQFEASPTVMILPTGLTSQTSTNVEFDHTNSFSLWIFLSITDPEAVESAVFDQMLDLVDLVVDTTEHADRIGQLSTIDPTFQNWMMNIARSRIYVSGGKGGAYLVADMTVQVSYSKDVF
ncbi:hypothetical protein AB4Y95_00155 [Arthrobacter sp. M-10]|uniref:hypothetical protein n=1 Tax=Arthrobacter sp. M-10 TaxID=3233037 RepID=UPI003F900E59